MSLNEAAAKFLSSIPFRPDAIKNMDCKQDSNGDLVCQADIVGSSQKTQLRIRDSGLKNIQCTRDASGVLQCEVESSAGREKIRF